MPSCPVTARENNTEMVLQETAFKAAAQESERHSSVPETVVFLAFDKLSYLLVDRARWSHPLCLHCLLSLSLRFLMKHLICFPFALQKNQGASGLALMVWMIPHVWDDILHVTGNRIPCLINASRFFVWLSFYLPPGCFAATVLSQKTKQCVLQFPRLFKLSFSILDTAMSRGVAEKRS